MKNKYSFNKNLIKKNVDSILLVYNENNGDMYELNELGKRIYNELEKGISIESILSNLNSEYNCSKKLIENDVWELLKRFEKLGIITFHE